MGAWSEDAFGNDTACDWAGEFSEDPTMRKVEEAIEAVLREEGHVDSDTAAECLVACEIIARLKGRWGERSAYSEPVDEWIEASDVRPSDAQVRSASRAMERILGEDSELRELWDEDGPNEAWRSAMTDLKARVTA